MSLMVFGRMAVDPDHVKLITDRTGEAGGGCGVVLRLGDGDTVCGTISNESASAFLDHVASVTAAEDEMHRLSAPNG